MSKKMCVWCGKNEAAVPINRGIGRFKKQICTHCHAERLKEDILHILEVEKKKREIR